MKAVVLTGIRQMELTDVPEPTIKKDDDVLLKIEKAGVCGSDVHYYETGRIGSQVVKYPFIVGHECTATVKAVGRKVSHVKVDQQVVVEPAVSCHNCDQCKRGRENTCFNLRFLGTPGQGNGCLCEYIIMPEENCFPINGVITLEQGVLCEPLAIAVYSVRQSGMPANADAAILGAGPIGLSCLISAKAENAKGCYVTEKIPERIQAAKNAGAAWVGNPDKQDVVKEILQQRPLGMDVVFECAGQQETIDQSVEMLKPGGKLMLVGIPRVERISFAIDKIRRKEVSIINVRRQNKCTQHAIDLVASGKASVDFMITHRFKLEQTQDAFDMVAAYRDGVVKALIEF
jgi:L-iditol 2-dehydrogenase